jgi:primosomal replication protein N
VNHFRLSASLVERSALRLTPAGIPVSEVRLQCRSEVPEAGVTRLLDFGVDAVGMGTMANELQAVELGSELDLEGFLAPRSRRSVRLVLHVTCCRRLRAGAVEGEMQGGTHI